MGKKKTASRLLASELEILEVLWRTGGVTIIEVQRSLAGDPGYTTVQTRLNRLVKKGVVRRSKNRPAKYSAAMKADEVVSGDLNLLLDRVSHGKVIPLVAHLVRDRSLSSEEIVELKQLIEQAEQRSKTTQAKDDSNE